jgi:hypothetical protein
MKVESLRIEVDVQIARAGILSASPDREAQRAWFVPAHSRDEALSDHIPLVPRFVVLAQHFSS